MSNKKIKLKTEDLIELEVKNLFRKGYKKKTPNPHLDVSNMVSKETYRNMSGKDKKIHQGLKQMEEDET